MEELTKTGRTIWFVVFILEGSVVIFCNIISLIVFSRKARTSKPCLLLTNQSVADLLVGLEAIYYSSQFVSSKYATYLTHAPKNGSCFKAMYIVSMITWSFVVNLSLASLAIIALDRAFAVFKPFRHRVLKAKHYYNGILGVWAISLVPSSFIVFLRCEEIDVVTKLTFASSVSSVLVTLIVLVAAYTSVYVKVNFFPVFQNSVNSHTQSQIKLSLTLFFASVASMASVLPSIVIIILVFVNQIIGITSPSSLKHIAPFLIFANSFMNFVIYAWRFPEFAADVKRFFCCKKNPVNAVFSIEMKLTDKKIYKYKLEN